MASWARQRKTLYATAAILVLAVAIGVPAFLYLYKAPTCSDGVKDGNEQGIDCGGSCTRLCPSAFLSPSVSWARFEPVAPGLYNLAAYVVNPNPAAGAKGVPYHMSLYDDQGIPITDLYGTMTLPPRRNAIAFQGAVSVGKRTPARLLFEFTAPPDWVSGSDPLSGLEVQGKDYREGSTSSSLSVKLWNGTPDPMDNVEVGAVLYDKDGNVVDFSKTVVDEIPAQGYAIAPFTWPRSHNGQVISIEVLPVAQ